MNEITEFMQTRHAFKLKLSSTSTSNLTANDSEDFVLDLLRAQSWN
jgi:hypothetical protein